MGPVILGPAESGLILIFTNDVELTIIKLECLSCFKLKIQCKLYSQWKKVHWLMYLLINFWRMAIWGPSLSTYKVLYQCDNFSVVYAIKKGSARDTIVMHLLRSLWFFTSHCDIDLVCEHIPGMVNTAADYLFRHNNFILSLNPGASLMPTPLPASLLEIISIPGLDWSSAHFSQLFISTINTV